MPVTSTTNNLVIKKNMNDEIESITYELRGIEAQIMLLGLQSFELAVQEAVERGQTYIELDQQYLQ